MGKLIDTLQERRQEEFLKQLRGYCNSKNNFLKHIEIDVHHIAWRSVETSDTVRNAFTPELIAALIIHGILNKTLCALKPFRIAVDGVFVDLPVIETLRPKPMSQLALE